MFNLLLFPLQGIDDFTRILLLTGDFVGLLPFLFFALFGGLGSGIFKDLPLHHIQLALNAIDLFPCLGDAAATQQAITIVIQLLRGIQIRRCPLQSCG